MDADRFLNLYRARWGEPPEVKGNPEAIQLWKGKVVDALPDAQADRVFDKVDELRGNSFARPRIGTFQAAMRALEVRAFEPTAGYCPHCRNGYLEIMGYRADDGKMTASIDLVAGHEPDKAGRQGLHITCVPCSCEQGYHVNPERHREAATAALDWVIARKREWGIDKDTFLQDGITSQERWAWALDTRLRDIRDEVKRRKAGKAGKDKP